MTAPSPPQPARTFLLWLLLGGLILLSYLVLRWFIVPVAWACILAYVTWPLNARLRIAMRGSTTGSAVLMTLLLTAAFILPLLGLIGLMQSEFNAAYQVVSGFLAQDERPLPEALRHIPWLGERLQQLVDRIAGDPVALRDEVLRLAQRWFGALAEIVGSVGRNGVKMGLVVLTVLFVYRDGDRLLDQIQRVMRSFIGPRVDGYLEAIGSTTKAVLYGLILTALAQGVLAGLGYWAAGIRAPALLGAFTALIALIPFGTPFVWGSLGVWLLMTGHTLEGVGLLLWGGLVVSWVDNLIRPIVISSASQIPFLLVMFGVLGGLAAFGLVGMFLGPVVMAVQMAVWREWLERDA